VKATFLSFVVLLCIAGPATAHGGIGLGLLGNFDGLGGWVEHQGGWRDHNGDVLGLGFGWGLGLGFLDPERVQTRFEDRFDMLQMQYDDGVAGGDDFFNTEEYDLIVNKTERLDDRYGLFVTGVERSIDRLGDVISIVNDDVTFLNDLLTNYQNDEDISPAKLERIELWIGRITDRLNMKVETLTERQMTLETNLPTYQDFQMDVSTFLSDIIAAGGGSPVAPALNLNSLAGVASLLPVEEAAGNASGFGSLSPMLVPEPATAGFVAMAIGGILLRRGRRA
jgi:hypothetical protein